ncbi:hypothetical protein KK062_16355 [Fulvivirgaceae bacterium PWU5]|uniref:Outer membrane protein beta-barrel domain-containing protein n=1 Tax=Dawidia cretensis TaxID=2782350 RepID=A0AAP2E0R8_9BACT|nr:hypothetical protein [Dawidia cretensis]MBT1709818.1 hypothetical protein [Dawidia cretensis]
MTQSLTFLCRFIVLLAFLTISAGAFAQHEYRIKLYQHTSSLETVYQRPSSAVPDEKSGDRHFTTGTFSVAFSIISLRGGFHHEFELFVPQIDRSAQGIQFPRNFGLSRSALTTDVISAYSFRYEINQDITNVTKRFVLNLGLAVNPYHINMEFKPHERNVFERNVQITGATINIIPRVSCQLTDRLSLELNVPVNVFDIYRSKQRIDNPGASLRAQTNAGTEHTFFQDIYTVRFGVAYTL